jgi:hypothetical protein
MGMGLPGKQLGRTFTNPLGMRAAQEASMIEKELQ